MAREITANIKVSIASLGNSKSAGELNATQDLAGNSVGFKATIGSTSAAAVSLGAGVTTPKILYVQNLDPIHSVVIDNVVSLDNWPQTIPAGQAAVFRPANSTLFAQAASAPAEVWIVAG